MMTVLASIPVLLAGLYLVGLAALAVISPTRAKSFLASFASTAFAHYVELVIRLIVGAALLLHAPHMKFSGLFLLMGWVLVITTTAMFAMPWRWHHRFSQWSVPMATRNMPLLALGSLAGGLFILVSYVLGPSL